MDIIELRPINEYFTHKKTKKVITHSEYREIRDKEIDRRWKEMPDNIKETVYENELGLFYACISDFKGLYLSEWDDFEEYYTSDAQGNFVKDEWEHLK